MKTNFLIAIIIIYASAVTWLWLSPNVTYDLNSDGKVDMQDVSILFANFTD